MWKNAKEYVFRNSALNPQSCVPTYAHTSYWETKKVLKKIVKTIKEWNDINVLKEE